MRKKGWTTTGEVRWVVRVRYPYKNTPNMPSASKIREADPPVLQQRWEQTKKSGEVLIKWVDVPYEEERG